MRVTISDFSADRAGIGKRNGDSTINLEEKPWKKIKSNRITNSNFEPSMKLLSRIVKVIHESNSIGKTSLSQEANINYHILSKHLDWLEKRHLIESIVEDGKVKMKLTNSGREFAILFRNLTVDDVVDPTDRSVNKTYKSVNKTYKR